MNIIQSRKIKNDILANLNEIYHNDINFTIYKTGSNSKTSRLRIDVNPDGGSIFTHPIIRAVITVMADHPEHEMIFGISQMLQTPKILIF